MRTRSLMVSMLLILAGLGSGCGQGWQMAYGKPAAQFAQEDVASKGKAFIGKKITVKGTVTKVDVRNPKSAWVHLGTTKCHLGESRAMAMSCNVGDTVYIDGILQRGAEDSLLLNPAILRDPTAPFSPEQ